MRRHKGFKVLGMLVGVVAAIGIAVLAMNLSSALAQFPGVTFLNRGTGVADVERVEVLPKGPTTVSFQKVTIGPGAQVPWHYHPGTVLFTITKGTLTNFFPDGTVVEMPVGFSDLERKGTVRRAENRTGEDVEVEIIFIVPEGQPFTIGVSDPTERK